MPYPSPTLTSLSGLLDFEAAARLGSFQLAAAELHKTRSALSQQIKQLEQSLGLQLFVRHARHVAITPAGNELAHTLRRQLGELRAQVSALRATQDPALLRVSTTHSLAMKWLIPRLHRFTEAHPAVDIRVEASDQLADLAGGGCDAALRYQDGEADEPLYREQWVLAHSPALAPAGLPLKTLLRQPLLHEGDTGPWLALLAAEGIKPSPHWDFSRSYSHGGLLVQAAVAGQGLALLPFALAEEDLTRGRLQPVAGGPWSSGYGYRLLLGAARREAAPVQAFAAWVKEELAGTQAACAAMLKARSLTPARPARTRAR